MSQLEILSKATPQLSTINAGTGNTENSTMVLEAVIIMLLEFYGVEWSPLQIREAAELWSSEYYWMHIAEIKHFLTKCKVGKFGKVFGKFSASMLMDWLGQYTDESLMQREELHTRKNDKFKYQNEKASDIERQSDRESALQYHAAQLQDLQAQVLRNMSAENTGGNNE